MLLEYKFPLRCSEGRQLDTETYQPDPGYWLEVVALVVFLKGWLEIESIWRVFRQTHQSRTPGRA